MLAGLHLNSYLKMKSKATLYRVYNKKGEYHHSYSATLKGAVQWAIDCAKTISGSVNEVSENGIETEIFNCKKSKCSP